MSSPICGLYFVAPSGSQPLADDPPSVWFASRRLGKTDVPSFGVEDGVVLPDKDLTQDPPWLRAALPEAGDAVAVALQGENKGGFTVSTASRLLSFVVFFLLMKQESN